MHNYSNSNEFNEFAIQEEFQHHQVTPPPKSECEAQILMKALKKIASLQDCWLPRDGPYIQLQESHLMNPWGEQQWESSWTTQILKRRNLRRITSLTKDSKYK